jgi:DNA-binding NarL/FixJ family response regulator
MTPIRVVIADDQSMVRHGFRVILESEPGIEVVAEAADGDQAVAAWRRFGPDVVLMDVRMPGLDGLQATREILGTDTDTQVIILTTFDLDEYVFESLRAGASGFLLKNASPEQLIQAVLIVARGEALLDPAVTRGVIERFARAPEPAASDRLDDLTTREREVLVLVARGRSNSEIADELVVAMGTVKTHVASILAKLGCRDRTQVVVLAYELGVVRPGG